MADAAHIAELIVKKLREGLSPEEERELADWTSASENREDLVNRFLNEEHLAEGLRDHWVGEKVWERVQAATEEAIPTRRHSGWWRWAAAAVLLLTLGSVYWLTRRHVDRSPAVTVAQPDVTAPQRARAHITLGDGQTIGLDSASSGKLASQGGVVVVKRADGQLVYRGTNGEGLFNTLYNPRGSRVVELTLADGTRVWLNAASSLRYPASFAAADRTVEVSGEAYFEVAADAKRPFRVKKGETTIAVLGTSFNVNAYEDEVESDVTLLTGAVKVADAHSTLVLQPGQQARVSGDKVLLDTHPDLDAVMAWKNGRFDFEGTGTEALMRELSRWYDVEIVYPATPIKEQHFRGGLPRDVPVSKVLELLEQTDAIHFRIEGRKIIIL
jgi:transmembrane sensor